MPHLLVDISSHGLGHLGQTAPVLNALAAAVSGLQLTVRSGLPPVRLEQRIRVPFRHVQSATDHGYAMRSAVDLDLATTARLHREFHADWKHRVRREADWLRGEGIDLVLANASYLALAGAREAGIRAIGMSSLNWADLLEHHFGGEDWAGAVIEEMRMAYGSAGCFLQVTPGLPMESLANVRRIGPVCQVRAADRANVARRLRVDPQEQWILVDMGGFELPIDTARWPMVRGLRYLVPQSLYSARADLTAFDSTRIDFIELMAAADVVVTKPGYGNFTEAACHGRPVLYIPRPGWTEVPFLTGWLHEHTRAMQIEREALIGGEFVHALPELLRQPSPPVARPTGIAEAVEAIALAVGN